LLSYLQLGLCLLRSDFLAVSLSPSAAVLELYGVAGYHYSRVETLR